ncbi:MAG: hypothetical protein J5565_05650 [Muribaculaceae bacterium]|nr:hypothetical protein [Muribaculaceae bacterium]
MTRHIVTFSHYSESGNASDTFHFSDKKAAQEKFLELRDVIEHNYADCPDVEIIDEPDFFGMRNPEDGSFARVTLD